MYAIKISLMGIQAQYLFSLLIHLLIILYLFIYKLVSL